MNSYKDSHGNSIPKNVIDRRVRLAKQEKLNEQINEHGYHFCEHCGISSGTYLDCSHDISVNDCQMNGNCELAYDVNNITILCRICHENHHNDKTRNNN